MVDSANSRNEGHEIRKEMEENHEQLMSKFVDYKGLLKSFLIF